jgi:hypothetical protein
MREYVEWESNDGTMVRIHRRVFAGLEQEEGDFAGVLFGTSAPGEVVVESFALGPGGPEGAAPVGYFRVASEEEEIGEAGLLSVVLLFRRDADGLRLARVVTRPRRPVVDGPAPSHRVLYRAGAPAPTDEETETEEGPRRWLWPAVAIAVGLVIGALGYTWLSGSGTRTESVRERPVDPMPVPPPVETPPPPAPAAPAQSGADRLAEPKSAGRVDRAEIQSQVRATLGLWTASLLAGDVEGHASLYAESVAPYFTKTRVTREQVADEVRGMLKRYGRVTTYRISDVTIAPVDADHAIANFRKAWSTAGRRFEGEERQQLKFAREASGWRIISEQELKVYWVRRK